MAFSESQILDEPAEVAVLGAIVLNNGLFDRVIDTLEPEHFGKRHHGDTYRAMRTMHLAGRAIDSVTLRNELARLDLLDGCGGPIFIARLTDGIPRSTNIAHYADLVRNKAILRELREAARGILASVEAERGSPPELLADAEQAIFRISNKSIASDWVSGEELAAELMPVIEALGQGGAGAFGLGTGFQRLDRMTRGLQSGDLVLLGARPSQGKTALALQLALHAAHEKPVAFLSVEMARQPLGLRGVVNQAQVNGFRLLSGAPMTEMDMHRVNGALTDIAGSKLYIDESPFLSPVHVRTKLRRLMQRSGPLGLVVIDYLQLMAPLPEHRNENKTNQVAGISRALKLLARELNVPFLVLAQLNRGLERSAEKRPNMADLRDSGALEQDADVVLLLHRPEVYEPDKPELKGLAELIIGKQRNGPIGTVRLAWHGEQMRFDNYTEDAI